MTLMPKKGYVNKALANLDFCDDDFTYMVTLTTVIVIIIHVVETI